MSTLVTTHGGLDRVVRGGQAVAGLFGRATAYPAGRNNARATKAPVALIAGLLARVIERAHQRRQERLFMQLMHDDPRVCADVQAAAARQEWR
ncbi:MAG: hypothetical protein LC121_01205 [Anaerolineae bacterium]|nr:hypothetical protein [Anaerolineae bacterium]